MSTNQNINYTSILINRLRTALKARNRDEDVSIPAWLAEELMHLATQANSQIKKDKNESIFIKQEVAK